MRRSYSEQLVCTGVAGRQEPIDRAEPEFIDFNDAARRDIRLPPRCCKATKAGDIWRYWFISIPDRARVALIQEDQAEGSSFGALIAATDCLRGIYL
jgi:hypothetical protein